jgi:diacylglycerol kinase (ATP)
VPYGPAVVRELALLVNPIAGNGLAARSTGEVLDRLRAAGFAVRELRGRDAEESARLADRAVTAGIEGLVVAGGDGLVHLAVQSIAAHSIAGQSVASANVTLGIIATGTGNDLARALGLPRGDPVAAADVVIASHTRRIDLARVDGRRFTTVLAAGFDSRVSERANRMRWPRGQLRYHLATLAELRVFTPLHYTLELDGVRRETDAMLVAVGNTPSYGGGLRMCEGALVDDGWLDVVVIKPVSKLELVKVYPRLFHGTHVSHPQYETHRVRSVSLAADGAVAYADGERLAPLPLTVRVEPAALRVFAPPSVRG